MARNGNRRGYECLEFAKDKPKGVCRVKGCTNETKHGRRVCCNCHIKAWRMTNPLKAAYACLRDHAKRRRIQFKLTLEEFGQAIEGTDYLTLSGTGKENLQIDRIKAVKGYEAGNIRVITASMNGYKGSTEDKRAWEMYNYQQSDNLNCGYHTIGVTEDCPF